MNETLSTYLYEFIEKFIPEVSNTSFNDIRKLNEEKRKFEGDRNNGKIYHEKPNLINETIGNKEEKNWEIIINENKVKKVIGKKKFSLSIEEENSINFDKNSFVYEVEDDENIKRGGFVKQITNNINSIITLNEISNDETLTNKISNLLNNINFNDYNNERRLIERKLNGLKNLQESFEINIYALPIIFSYPLFKTHLLGAKITLITSVIFIPL